MAMARLVGQFLLLGRWCDTCKQLGDEHLEFVPIMNVGEAKYVAGAVFVRPNGTQWEVIREVTDWDGFLSWLMSQTMRDPVDNRDVPAMQSLQTVMMEAYNHGVSDERRRLTKELSNLGVQYGKVLNAKQKKLDDLRRKLQAANERETEAEKTIADLQRQLELYRPVADSAETEPTVPAEPQPEPVPTPTNGESNESNNTND